MEITQAVAGQATGRWRHELVRKLNEAEEILGCDIKRNFTESAVHCSGPRITIML